MITVWRLTKAKYAPTCFDGEGGRTTPGRWSTGGRRIVYTSESAALATLETLVHLDEATMLRHYRIRRATFDERLVEELRVADLARDWKSHPAPRSTQGLGQRWLEPERSAALRVPSVVVDGWNYLLNPEHPDFVKVRVLAGAEPIDTRLVRTGR